MLVRAAILAALLALSLGARIGVYEILGSLGAGGMGEVYRARDTKARLAAASGRYA